MQSKIVPTSTSVPPASQNRDLESPSASLPSDGRAVEKNLLQRALNWLFEDENTKPLPQKTQLKKTRDQKPLPFNEILAKQAFHQAMPYINFGLLLFFLLGVSFFSYRQLSQEAPLTQAYPSTPTRPNRQLSFQGRLTDTAQNPITSSTSMRFYIYDSGPSTSGGTLLWDSTACNVTPDQDGIFSVGLGSDCGSEIAATVFSENVNTWLEVEIASETLSPRQPLNTVAYALNAETLQGYPVFDTAVANSVLAMNASGDVVLGSTSPTLQATGTSFTIEGNTLIFQTTSGSNGDVVISPDGTGSLISEGYLYAPGATLSATYAGGTALVVQGGPSGTANIQEWQDGSGTTVSVVDENGNFGIGTSNPIFKLQVENTLSSNSYEYGLTSYVDVAPSANLGAFIEKDAIYGETTIPGSNTYSLANVSGVRGISYNYGSGNISNLAGGSFFAFNNNAGSHSRINGVEALSETNGGTVTDLSGVYVYTGAYGGSATNLYGVYVDNLEQSGATVTNRYGLYLDSFTGSATNDYGIYQAGSSQNNYFGGNVGIYNQSDLRLYESDNTNYTGFQSPATLSSDLLMTLPDNAGSSGYVLQTNGSGTLSWVDASLAASTLWSRTSNVLYSSEYWADDLVLGGNSTASATLHLFADGNIRADGNQALNGASVNTNYGINIGAFSGDGQRAINARIDADTDGDTLNGFYIDVDTGTSSPTSASRNARGFTTELGAAADNGGYQLSEYGLYNSLDLSQNHSTTQNYIYGTYNSTGGTYSGDRNLFFGLFNDLEIGGTNSRGYGVQNTLKAETGDGLGQDMRGVETLFSTGDTGDTFYGHIVFDGGGILGGTAYGNYLQLQSNNWDNAWSIYVTEASAHSYFGSPTGFGSDTTPDSQLEVEGSYAGNALVTLNETGGNDILTASSSGTSVFTVSNDGYLGIGTAPSSTYALNVLSNDFNGFANFSTSWPGGTPTLKLENTSTNSSSKSRLLFANDGGDRGFIRQYSSTDTSYANDVEFGVTGGYQLYFSTNGTQRALIDSNGISAFAQGDLRLYESDNGNFTGFQSPATLSSNLLMTLPSTAGSNGYVLQTDGSGTLSWADAAVAAGSKWTRANSTLYSTEYWSDDVIVGGNSTASADIQLFADGSAIFNQQGNNANIRFEGDTDQYLLFTKASTDQVGIGGNPSLGGKLEVYNTSGNNIFFGQGADNTYAYLRTGADGFSASLRFQEETGTLMGSIGASDSTSTLTVSSANDLSLSATTDLLFTDDNATSIPLTVADSSINANLAQGLIDAINDLYDAETGTGGGLWTRASNVLYTSEYWQDDIAIGGNSTASADIQLFADGSAVFNQQGNDADFRIEGSSEANLLFADAGQNAVGINTNDIRGTLTVSGNYSNGNWAGYPATAVLENTDAGEWNLIFTSAFNSDWLGYYVDDNAVVMAGNGVGSLINFNHQTGHTGIGDSTPESRFEVEGTSIYDNALVTLNETGGNDVFTASVSGTTAFVIDESGYVGIGTKEPAANFNVYEASPTSNQILIQAGTSGDTSVFTVDEDGDTFISGILRFQGAGLSPVVSAAHPQIYEGVSDSLVLQARTNGANGDLIFATGNGDGTPTEQLRILDIGNVGIGTSTPDSKLTIEGLYGGNALVTLNETGGNDIFTASASGTSRFVIANNGNVGIGTNLPNSMLHINGGSSQDVAIMLQRQGVNDRAVIEYLTAGGVSTWELGFDDDNTNSFHLRNTRLNENIFTVSDNASSEVIFNNDGLNNNFRIEGDTNPNLFFVDGVDDSVGIGTNNPINLLEVNGDAGILAQGDLRLYESDNGNYTGFQSPATLSSDLLMTLPSTAGSNGYVLQTDGSGTLSWVDAAAAASTLWSRAAHVLYSSEYWADDLAIGGNSTASADIQLLSTGGAVFNEQGNSVDFRIESDTNANIFFVDGSTNRIGIGANSPDAQLDITGLADTIQLLVQAAAGQSENLFEVQNYTGSALAYITSDGAIQAANFATDTAAGNSSVQIGQSATVNGQQRSIAIGNGAYSQYASIVLGRLASSSANNQLVIGSESAPINTAYIGEGVTSTTPSDLILNTTGGSGTDINGANFTIAGGRGTGTGTGGEIRFQTATPGTTGSTLNTLTTRMVITDDGNVGIGTTSPQDKLDIDDGGLIVRSDSDTYLQFSDSIGSHTTPFFSLYNNSGTPWYTEAFRNNPTDNWQHGIVYRATSYGFTFAGAGNFRIAGNNSTDPTRFQVNSDGSTGVGTDNMEGFFNVRGSQSAGNALAIFNETGSNNILTASVSGTTAFTLDNSGNTNIMAQGDLRLYESDNGNYTGFQSPATLSSDLLMTLPSTAGSNGYILQTDGSGTLSWADAATAAGVIWNRANNTVFTTEYWSDDLIIGGNSTASADIQLFANGAATFNAQQNDADFNIRSQSNANLFYVDASTDRVGIGTSTPGSFFDVLGSGTVARIRSTSGISRFYQDVSQINLEQTLGSVVTNYRALTSSGQIGTASDHQFNLTSNGVVGITLDTTSNVGIGSTSPDHKLEVSGTYAGNALVSLNETGSNDILTASASGTTRFRIDNGGYTYAQRFVDLANSSYFLDPAATDTSLTVVGKAGIGTSSPVSLLDVNGSVTGKALVSLNETGSNDIFTASASGTTRMTVDNNGTLQLFTSSSAVSDLSLGTLADRTDPGASFYSGYYGDNILNIDTAYDLVNGHGNSQLSYATITNTGASQSYYNTDIQTRMYGTGNVSDLNALYTYTGFESSGTASQVLGQYNQANATNGTVTDLISGEFVAAGTTAANITDLTGVRITALGTGGATITNAYGLKIGDVSGATNNYSIYTGSGDVILDNANNPDTNFAFGTTSQIGKFNVAGGYAGNALAVLNETNGNDIFTASASGTSRFVISNAGDVGIGTTSPLAALHVNNTSGIRISEPGFETSRYADFYSSGNQINTDLSRDWVITRSPHVVTISNSGISTNGTFISSALDDIIEIGSDSNGSGITRDSFIKLRGTVIGEGGTGWSLGNNAGDIVFNYIQDNTAAGDSGTTVFSIERGGNARINAQGDLRLYESDNGNYTGFQSPATLSSDLLMTLPDNAGSSGYVLQTNGSGTLSWVDAAAASGNLWTLSNGSVYPTNSSTDLLVGGNSTDSAKFAFINVNSGTPTASISGSTSGYGLSLDGDGTIATTLNRTLYLNPSGGNVQIGTPTTTSNNASLNVFATDTAQSNISAIGRTSQSGPLLHLKQGASASQPLILGVNSSDTTVFNVGNDGTITLNGGAAIRGSGGDLILSASGNEQIDIRLDGAVEDFRVTNSGTDTYLIVEKGLQGNVGIGDETPESKLKVEGTYAGNALVSFNETGSNDIFTASASGSTQFVIANNGNVGIRDATPDADLEINSDAVNSDLLLLTAFDGSRLGRFTETSGGAGWFEVDTAAGSANVLFRGDGGDNYISSGEFGIGTTSPGTTLDVNGSGRFTIDSAGDGLLTIQNTTGSSGSTAEATGLQFNLGGSAGTFGAARIRSVKINDFETNVFDADSNLVFENFFNNSYVEALRLYQQGGAKITETGNQKQALQIQGSAATYEQLLIAQDTTDDFNDYFSLWIDGSTVQTYFDNTDSYVISSAANRTGTSNFDFITLDGPNSEIDLNGDINVLAQADLRLYEPDNTNYTGFQAPATLSSDLLMTLPDNAGSSGFILQTNGSGTLSWVDASIAAGLLWSRANNTLYSTEYWQDDLIIGGNSTASADIQLYADGAAVFNEQGNDADFRIEGNSLAALFFVDASADRVGIGGVVTPAAVLDVAGDAVFDNDIDSNNNVTIDSGSTTAQASILSFADQGAVIWQIQKHASNDLILYDNSNSRGAMRLYTSTGNVALNFNAGNLGVGTNSPNALLNVEGTRAGNALAIFNETGSNDIFTASSSGTTRLVLTNAGNLGVGTASPNSLLHVNGVAQFGNSLYLNTTSANYFMNAASNYTNIGGWNGVLLTETNGSDSSFARFSSVDSTEDSYLLTQAFGIGTSTPASLLNVEGTYAGNALVSLNETGSNDIFTASSSGTTAFVINNSGQVGIGTNAPGRILTVSDTAPIIRIEDENTTLTTDDSIGRLEWYSNDNNTPQANTVYIEGVAEDSGSQFGLAFATSNASSVLTERLRIDGYGSVGIGTNDTISNVPTGMTTDWPSRRLVIQNAATNKDAGILLRNSSNALGLDLWFDYVAGDTNSYIDSLGNSNTSNIVFRTKTAGTPIEVMTLTGDGNVGIGTTVTPTNLLEVNGDAGVLAQGDLRLYETDNGNYTGFQSPATLSSDLLMTLPDNAGSSGYVLQTNGSGTLSWVDAAEAASTLWSRASNVLYSSEYWQDDLAIGGNSTASADIQLFANGAAVFNEQGNDADFRVEATGQANALFVRGSDGYVGIGTNTPSAQLNVLDNVSGYVAVLENEAISNADGLSIVTAGATSTSNPFVITADSQTIFNSQADGVFQLGSGSLANSGLTIRKTASSTSFDGLKVQSQGTSNGDLAGIAFGVDGALAYTKSTIFHSRTGANGIGDLVFAIDSNSDAASVATTDEKLRITSDGLVGIGTSTPASLLNVEGTYAGNALVSLNETGSNDIFTASASGTTRFRIDTNGYTYAQRFVDLSNSSYYLDPAATGTSLTTAGAAGIGTASPNDMLEVLSTTDAQLRLAYDTSNYAAFQVLSDGGTTYSALGTDADLNFDFTGATDGDFSVNGNDLFVDTSTGNVAINSTSPGNYNLYVRGESDTTLALFENVWGGSGINSTVVNRMQGTSGQNDGGVYMMQRSGGTVADTPTSIGNNSGIGSLTAQGYDGSQYRDSAAIKFRGDGGYSSGDSPGRIEFLTTPDGTSTLVERMRIDNAGNIGIGTTSPETSFNIEGGYAGNALAIFNETNGNDIFSASASGTTRLTLDNSGLLSLPTDSASAGISIGAAGDLDIYHDGTNSVIANATGDLQINGVAASEVVFNESGADVDFRVETTYSENNFRIIGSNGYVGIGDISIPNTYLHLQTTNGDANGDFLITNIGTPGFNNGAMIQLQKALNGTTIVPAGNTLSTLDFQGYDGSVYRSAAQIKVVVDGGSGSGDMPGRLGFFTTPDGSTTPTEKLRIDNAGLVSLPIDGSSAGITIGASGDLALYHDGTKSVINNATGNLEINGVAFSDVVINENGGDIDFRIEANDDANAFFIDGTNGNIGIGTNSPGGNMMAFASDIGGVEIQGLGDYAFNIYSEGGIAFRVDSDNDTATNYAFYDGANTQIMHLEEGGQLELLADGSSNGLEIGAGGDLDFYHDGTNSVIANATGDLQINGVAASEVVFNESGADVDFRVEGTGLANALFVEGSSGRVGIGTGTPTSGYALDIAGYLQVGESTNGSSISLIGKSGTSNNYIFDNFTDGNPDFYTSSTADRYLNLRNDNTGTLGLTTDGSVGVGTTSPDSTLEVIGNAEFDNDADSTLNVILDSGSTTAQASIITFRDQGSNQWQIRKNNTNTLSFYDTSNSRSVFTLYQSGGDIASVFNAGNFGIGTTSPDALLNVEGTRAGNATVIINETGSNDIFTASTSGTTHFTIANDGSVGIGDSTPTEAQLVLSSDIYVGSFASSGTAALCWDNSGGSLINDCSGSPVADYAEIYPSENNVDYGEVVILGPNRTEVEVIETDRDGNPLPAQIRSIPKLAQANQAYAQNIVGITSRNWNDFTSTGHNSVKDEDNPIPVALVGRVPVKVSSINGPINPGDPITSSVIPGTAMKSTRAGNIIGRALESYDNSNPSEIGTIMVYVKANWYDPDTYLTDVYDLHIEKQLQTSTNPTYVLRDSSDQVIERVTQLSQAAIANLRAGYIETQELLAQVRISAPEIETESLETDVISPLSGDDLALQLGDSDGSSQLQITNDQQQTVASINDQGDTSLLGDLLVGKNIDADGNISGDTLLSNLLQTETAEIGTLTADGAVVGEIDARSARLEQLEGRLASLETINAQTAEIVNATVSGTLYAEEIAGFKDKVAAALEEPSLLEKLMAQSQPTSETGLNLGETTTIESSTSPESAAAVVAEAGYQTLSPEVLLSPSTETSESLDYTLADLGITAQEVTLTADAVFINQYLKVNGPAYIADSLGVAGNIFVDQDLVAGRLESRTSIFAGTQVQVGSRTILADGSLSFATAPTNTQADNTFAIQPSGSGTLSLMAGLMTLDEAGQVTITGDVYVAGSVEVEDTLLTNLLQPSDFTQPFQVQLAQASDGQVAGTATSSGTLESRFEIVNELGVPVATISAQGSAEFASVKLDDKLAVDHEDLRSVDGNVIVSSKSTGNALLRQGETEITIKSKLMTENSLVYITPRSDTGNQTLFVKSQTAENLETEEVEGEFVVGFSQPIGSDVEFNWWIVN